MTMMLQSQMQHSMWPIPSQCSILLNSGPRSRRRPTLQRIGKAERGAARAASHDLRPPRDLGIVHLVIFWYFSSNGEIWILDGVNNNMLLVLQVVAN